MAARDMLAQLFLAGRSPEEQQQRILRQRHDAGLSGSGGAFPSGPPGNAFPPSPQGQSLDMTAAGPWGAGQDPMTTAGAGLPQTGVPMPTPSPGAPPYIPSIITGGAGPGQDPSIPIPTPRPGSPMMPPDPMAASAPTNNPPPPMEIAPSPFMGRDPMAASAPTNNPPPMPEIAPSPVMPRDPMAASAPTEIGGYEAQRQFGLPKQKSKPKQTPKPKSSRAEQTKNAQKRFKEKAGGVPQNAQPRQS